MEEFLKVINKFLKEERQRTHSTCKSFFVEHKAIIPFPTFKVIKSYNVCIYLVKQDKEPLCVFNHKVGFNSNQRSQEDVYKEICESIQLNFLKLIKDFEWEKIINGHFEEKIHERVEE